MGTIAQKNEQKIEQIVQFAEKNNNSVSYITVVDIIKDQSNQIDEDTLIEITNELSSRGILVHMVDADEDYSDANESENTFLPADVSVTQIPTTVYGLMERLKYEEIELKPKYQRKGNLWSDEQQSQLIESLMLKIPLPAFYFDASVENKWIVIDGLQRLSVFKNYLVGDEHGVKKEFKGLQFLKDFDGFTFDDLPRQYSRRIQEASIVVYTVEKGTPRDVVYNIFRRINTCGLQLTDQEIRNALYQGAVTELTEELSASNEFLEATQFAILADRMLDREYILRYIAFTELDYTKEYKGNIDDFLIKAMKYVNHYEADQIERVRQNFMRTMIYCKDIFGKYAFRKYNKNWRRGPINKAIFELWSICFSKRSEAEMNNIVSNKGKVLVAFQNLLQEESFLTALKAGDKYSVNRRVERVEQLLEEFYDK